MKLRDAVEKAIIKYYRGESPKSYAEASGKEWVYTPEYLNKLVNGDKDGKKS